jgi:hypothetical protein
MSLGAPPGPRDDSGRQDWPSWRRRQKIKRGQTFLSNEFQFSNFLTGNSPTTARDRWIEVYFAFLDQEIARLNAGIIAKHYRRCAEACYREFQSCQAPRARFRAWLAIRTCCQWLMQLNAGPLEGSE